MITLSQALPVPYSSTPLVSAAWAEQVTGPDVTGSRAAKPGQACCAAEHLSGVSKSLSGPAGSVQHEPAVASVLRHKDIASQRCLLSPLSV